MSEIDERIARFQKMTEADPANELGHFSLGRALLEAGRAAEAAVSFRRVLELNPGMSKAYQHLAESLVESGQRSDAVETLHRGLQQARARGDMMPARAMEALLQELGEPLPAGEDRQAVASESASSGGFRCRRCGAGEEMAHPPMRGPLGEEIRNAICGACWREWIGMGTKLINELRLDLREPSAQDVYDRHMKDFLGLN